MAVETYKVIKTGGKKRVLKEMVESSRLMKRLSAGWFLTSKEAKDGKHRDDRKFC